MDADTQLRRQDTTKGRPLRVLSLDGGGVRGYSMLIIVERLMYRTYGLVEGHPPSRRHQIPKPCDHFDLIVGTGTGGLIAIMLGRLRLDIEQCKELYTRLTRMVFESDKTKFGIPYRSTLFKASMLESAIKEAVREHTISEKEGNDGKPPAPVSPLAARKASNASPRRHQSNASTVSFSARSPSSQISRPAYLGPYGDPDALLYDERRNRTKTAVIAMYKGARRSTDAAVLRSYDSRKEPPPDFDCRIWEAGRATCAIGMAFKEITIGNTVFHDDGAGVFNPSPVALDEAVNEWPNREVGVFVSVGTGKRPKGTDPNQHAWYEDFLGEFAEGRKKLIAKIENCETIHERMRDYLVRKGVSVDNYYRFNVEVGVGEFGMNEFHRLGEISKGTRNYLDREEDMVKGASWKLGSIHTAKLQDERAARHRPTLSPTTPQGPPATYTSVPFAVELPGDMPTGPPQQAGSGSPDRESYDSGYGHLTVSAPAAPGSADVSAPSSRASNEHQHSPVSPPGSPRPGSRPAHNSDSPAAASAYQPPPQPEDDGDRLVINAPTPAQYRTASGSDKIAITGSDEYPRRQPRYNTTNTQNSLYDKPLPRPGQPQRIEPPPLPPKTPLPEHQINNHRRNPSHPPLGPAPPYPIDEDGPPPVINMARKPDFRKRY